MVALVKKRVFCILLQIGTDQQKNQIVKTVKFSMLAVFAGC